MLSSVKGVDRFEHRTQWVAESIMVSIGITTLKVPMLARQLLRYKAYLDKTVLIAGGQGKGADFTPLADVVQKYARAVVLFGEDAEQIALALKGDIPIVFALGME